jgi:hypothetical protein
VAPSASDVAITNLPAGCNEISLRTTTGEQIDLNGVWVVDESDEGVPATWWIHTAGDCIWGTGIYDDYREDEFSVAASVQTMEGTISPNFVIDSTVVLLGPVGTLAPGFGPPARVATVRWSIVDDGGGTVNLEEDRESGAYGPRCPDPLYCPAPLILQRPD